jgi:Protein of unknown function (DUF2948)
MPDLKLIAFDAEDISVISAHTQDALMKVGEMAYLPAEKRFAAILKRFDWRRAIGKKQQRFERRQAGLRFERVLGARVSGLDLSQKTQVLSLLAIGFEPNGPDDPAGAVTMVFAGGSAIRLDVECLEAELKDLGPAWHAKSKPRHPVEESE